MVIVSYTTPILIRLGIIIYVPKSFKLYGKHKHLQCRVEEQILVSLL